MGGAPAPFNVQAAGQAADELRRTLSREDEPSAASSLTVGKNNDSQDTTDGGDDTEGPGHGEGHQGDISTAQEGELTGLARRFSELSRRGSSASAALEPVTTNEDGTPVNPFLDAPKLPQLDPHDSRFSVRTWLRTMLAITTRDPTRYPKRTAGVSFRNVNVYGYGSAADYQADVGNTPLKGVSALRGALGMSHKQRIDILRGFEGVVEAGEMLVVLGRPGR